MIESTDYANEILHAHLRMLKHLPFTIIITFDVCILTWFPWTNSSDRAISIINITKLR